MIIIDYNAVALGAMFAMGTPLDQEDLMKHTIINTVRSYYKRYKQKYGKLVIACDNRSWRKSVYKEYKFKRSEAKEESDYNWDEVFRVINGIQSDLREHFPFLVISIPGAEADDIVGALVERTQEFGQGEDVMIISGDKDFIQLQKYKNVKQISPITKKAVTAPDPRLYLKEHIIRGDKGDGVPNIKSPDTTFSENGRQKAIKQDFLDTVLAASDPRTVLTEEEYKNYIRNETMIDLSKTPKDIVAAINELYEQELAKTPRAGAVLNYFIRNRMKNLIECVGDFT